VSLSDVVLVEIETGFWGELGGEFWLVLDVSLVRNAAGRMVVEVAAYWVVRTWSKGFVLLRSESQTSSV
jgi:hypothetical protein